VNRKKNNMLYLGCNMKNLRDKITENKIQTNSQMNNKKEKMKSNLTTPVNDKVVN